MEHLPTGIVDSSTTQGPPEDAPVTDRLLAFLRANEADFHVLTHVPVRTSQEAAHARGTPLEQGAKALVFQADERTVLLVVQAHRRVHTRAFKALKALTGLEVGAVPPFGHLLGLLTYVDARLLELPRIAFNAGSRTTSVVMATRDFARLANPIIGRFAAEDER